jgi:queuine tRNA-ribosyltransferase
MSRLPFSLDRTSSHSKARAGRFRTLHGEVQTPVFMPVGTQATVKGQTVESLRAAGSRVLLANTYHLSLRPGPEVFQRVRRHSPVHELGRTGADRLRRVPDLLAVRRTGR